MTTLTPMYWLGLFFIFLVAIIWSASSIVAQYLYTSQDFDSPFVLTYIGTSLFILFIPTRLIYERRHRLNFWNRDCPVVDEKEEIIPWNTKTVAYEQIPSSTEEDDDDDERNRNNLDQEERIELLSHYQHFQIAWKIAPIWFISNFTYNASLELTSITSSTVLASTGSLFTFTFALLSGDERFACTSLLGVLLGVLGSSLTAWSDVKTSSSSSNGVSDNNITISPTQNADNWVDLDFFATDSIQPEENDQQNGMGDVLGLLSAVGYGAYTILIRLLCPPDERQYSMQLLLGYIGLVNGLVLFPFVLYQCLFTNLTQELTTFVLGCLAIKGLFDNVLSDYLWARAVILTSATVATVGTGLTIPLALLTDFVWHDDIGGWNNMLGALSVLVGFVLVNLGGGSSESDSQYGDGNDNNGYGDNGNSSNGSLELSEEAKTMTTSIPVI